MINIKNDEEIDKIRKAGNVSYLTLRMLDNVIKPGISTKEIDVLAENFIRSYDMEPAFLNYDGFPNTVCASINDEVVHGIPGDRILKDGDIISIDLGAKFKEYCSDTAYTYTVGKVKDEILNLISSTKEALYSGLSVIKEGVILNEVCEAIGNVAIKNNLGVVKELTGHGVGKGLHEEPYIPNYKNDNSNIVLKEGMVLAIEPMFTLGGSDVWILENDWTIATQDKSPSAHFEHTIVVTKNGYEILTGE